MNDGSTRELQTLLSEWKIFQKDKLAARNMYPCVVFGLHGTLTFLTEGDHRLVVKPFLSIMLNDIRGFNTEDNNTISITLKGQQNPIRMEFPDMDIFAVVVEELENFIGEATAEPTPPSSSSESG